MFYRITVDLLFHDSDPANDILEEARRRIDSSFTLHPGQTNQERGFILYQKCHHDTDPRRPCDILEHHLSPL